MEKVELKRPDINDEEAIKLLIAEFKEEKETLHGGNRVEDFTYEKWLDLLAKEDDLQYLPANYVSGKTFLIVSSDDKRLLGLINIRHYLNDYLINYGGHIGYCIRLKERNQGYATAALALALQYLKKQGERQVLITCNKDNPASAKVIINNGGSYENEIPEEGTSEVIQRYWIALS